MDVVALGELLIDFAPVSTNAAGYPTLAAQPGGAPGNFLAALQTYGCTAALIGKVGADRFGDLLRATLAGKGIDTRGIVSDPAVFTTLAFVTLDATGNREFSFARKPGADTCLRTDEVDLALIDEAKAFHFGTLSLTDEPARAATQKAVAYAKEKGRLISFDPNLRKPLWPSETAAKEQIEWGLHQADIKLVLATGMCRGEACGLRWSDINRKKRSIHIQRNVVKLSREPIFVKPPKTASGDRVVYVSKEMAKLLKSWKQQCAWLRQQAGETLQEDDYLFRQPGGDPMVPTTFTFRFKKILR